MMKKIIITFLSSLFLAQLALAEGPEKQELIRSHLDKTAYKAIKFPPVIHKKEQAKKIFKQLEIKTEDVDFKKYVVVIVATDQNNPNRGPLMINPRYSKDGTRLFLSPMPTTLIGFSPSNNYKFAIYKVSKGKTKGFSKWEFKNGKSQLVDLVDW